MSLGDALGYFPVGTRHVLLAIGLTLLIYSLLPLGLLVACRA